MGADPMGRSQAVDRAAGKWYNIQPEHERKNVHART